MTETKTPGIRIGERSYPALEDFTIGEAEVIKQVTGLTPHGLITQLQTDPTDPQALRAYAWAVLHREDAKLEPDADVITNAFIGAMFEAEEASTNGVPPNRASRRKTSSSPAAATSKS